jgi:hypothetical protein
VAAEAVVLEVVAAEVQDSRVIIAREKAVNAKPRQRSGARKIEFIITDSILKN